jgi:hypothetical protein
VACGYTTRPSHAALGGIADANPLRGRVKLMSKHKNSLAFDLLDSVLQIMGKEHCYFHFTTA